MVVFMCVMAGLLPLIWAGVAVFELRQARRTALAARDRVRVLEMVQRSVNKPAA